MGPALTGGVSKPEQTGRHDGFQIDALEWIRLAFCIAGIWPHCNVHYTALFFRLCLVTHKPTAHLTESNRICRLGKLQELAESWDADN